jgi:hypothetical protein
MPLIKPRKGATKKQRRQVASKNISREIRAGVPQEQAIAIGLRSAGISKKKRKPVKPKRRQRR